MDDPAQTDDPTRTAVVVAGGDAPVPGDLVGLDEAVRAGAPVVAVDAGLHHVHALWWRADHVVGDFDSVDAELLAAAVDDGALVERHPADKDATDLELGLDLAVRLGARRLVVLGAAGGRLDHLLANAALLAADRYATVTVEARLGGAVLHVVRHRLDLTGPSGTVVTLLPVHGPATGVTTVGLRYPLRGETLAPGSSRGVSNELVGGPASVALAAGVLTAVLPAHVDVHLDPPTEPPPDPAEVAAHPDRPEPEERT